MSQELSALSHDDLVDEADGAEQAALVARVAFEQTLRSATSRWLRL
jgi:hypothetical protein